MICPQCGCPQRKTDTCIQCHALLSKGFEKQPTRPSEKSRPSLQSDPLIPAADPLTLPEAESPEKKLIDALSSLPPVKPSGMKAGSKNILITTTQRVEGKRISTYYGLIHAGTIIGSSDLAQAKRPTDRQKQFKAGVSEALQGLRKEAALLKANAVIATSFNFQQIDSMNLLLSVVGTAVLLKDPAASA